VDSTTYSQFSRSIHERFGGERAPLEVSVEVTRRCPLHCLQCYNNLALGDQRARSSELSKDEHFHLLDDLAELGCFWLLYTGGEIFARKDFLEIYTFNPAGTTIWAALDRPKDLDELTRLLEQEYEVSGSDARADVLLFLNEMRAAGLVAVLGGDGNETAAPETSQNRVGG